MEERGIKRAAASDEHAAVDNALPEETIICHSRRGLMEHFEDSANLSPWQRFVNWLRNQAD